MTWSARFLSALEDSQVSPLFVVESIAVGEFWSEERDLKLSSFAAGPDYIECITIEGSSVSHGVLTPGSWSRSQSSMSLGLIADVRRLTTRGQVVQVRMGVPGWDIAAFESIFVGQVKSLRWSAGRWTLQLIDIVGALTARFSTITGSSPLFTFAGDGLTATDVSATYLAGSSPLNVTDTSNFHQSSYAGGEGYVVWVEPISGDPPFYLQASSKTGTTFAVGAGPYFETTPVTAGGSSVVREVVYSRAHPIQLIHRVLASTGNATNGPFDVLPEAWGYGLPEELMDADDMAAFATATSPTGFADYWALLELTPQDNGLSWIQGFLAPGAFFLTQRQGLLTCRGIVPPDDQAEAADTITDDDIVPSSLEYATWDDMQPVEYTRVTTDTAHGLTDIVDEDLSDTRPHVDDKEILLDHAYYNAGNWAVSVNARLAPFALRIAERVSMTCQGLRLAHLALGDAVALSTALVTSRYESEGYGFDGRRILVVGGGPDWFQGTVSLQLLAPVPFSTGA